MASKREFDDADDSEAPEPQPKRPKKQNAKSRQHQNSNIDPTWGQKYVFSGNNHATTIPAGEEDDFEDDADAMAYLKSVRQEANGIPHTLVAPKVKFGPQLPADFQREGGSHSDDHGRDEPIDRSIYDDGTGDMRGYYEDGAYTAMPESWEDEQWEEEGEEEEVDEEKALHEAYFAAVMDQYHHLRSVLNAKPPRNAASRLSSSQPTCAPGSQQSAITLWSRILRSTDPHPLQVALMSKDTILQILRILLGGKFLRRGYTLPERTSRWIWALLARLPEKGELNYSEIGWVRDLGRRAVLLGRSLSEMAALREELADGGLGTHEAVDDSSTDSEVLGEVENLPVEGEESLDGNDDRDSTEESPQATKAEEPPANADADAEEGEVEEEKEEGEEDDEDEDEDDVAMDLESDSEAEDGETAEQAEDLEDVKARLLAQLDNAPSESELREEQAQEAAKERSRANLRATLNMILTVTGEFYGQRDLLEFREPFVGM